MVRLCNVHRYSPKKRIFYFNTLDECNEFINVFNENSCNVKWEEPREIPDTTRIKTGERELMRQSPRERAEKALNWGFNIINDQFSVFTR